MISHPVVRKVLIDLLVLNSVEMEEPRAKLPRT